MATAPNPKPADAPADTPADAPAATTAAPEALAPAAAPAVAGRVWPESIRVRGVNGDMRNPFTQQWIPQGESKKVVVDAWIIAQVEGGKIVETDD